MLESMNAALRGVYVIEGIDLAYAGDARIGVTRADLAPVLEENGPVNADGAPEHRLSLGLDWPQDLACRVRGYRPAGGGLPPFLRAAARHLAGVDQRRAIGFALNARLSGEPRVGFVFAGSRTQPFPALRRVDMEAPPAVRLDRDALTIDDGDDASFLKILYDFVPKEVLVGMLEQNINDALARPAALKACAWSAPKRGRAPGPGHRAPAHDLRARVASLASKETLKTAADALRAKVSAGAARLGESARARRDAVEALAGQALDDFRDAIEDAPPPPPTAAPPRIAASPAARGLDDFDDDDDGDAGGGEDAAAPGDAADAGAAREPPPEGSEPADDAEPPPGA
jgi:hypothetical protein